MKMSSVLRTALVALVAFAAASLSQARADEGFATQTICKAGWIIGGSGGSGVLNFRGLAKRNPPIVQHPTCCHNQRRKRSPCNVRAARAALLFFFLEDAGGNKRGTVIRAKLG
jgi:hypothetical protein